MLVLLVAALSLAACTSSPGSAGSAGPGSHDPLTIFTMNPPASPAFGDISVGVRAAAAAINQHGGVEGHPIKVVTCDSGAPLGTPNDTATCLAQMQSDPSVLALIGAFTFYTSSLYDSLKARGIPNLGSLPATSADFTNALSFPLQPSNDEVFAGLSIVAATNGCKKAVFAGSSDMGTIGSGSAAWSAGAKYEKLPLAPAVDVPASQVDLAPTVASIRSEGVDCIGFGLTGPQLQPLMTAIKSSGGGIRVIASVVSAPQPVLNALGPLASGLLLDNILKPPGTATDAVSRLQSEVKLVAPGGAPNLPIIEPQWGGVHLFAQAAKIALDKHKTVTPAYLTEALHTITNFDYGFTGPINFSGPGPIPGAPSLRLTTVYEEKVVNGTPVPTGNTVDVAPALK